MWFALYTFDNLIICRYVVCIAKGMKPHLVLNDEEKQQRFDKDGGHRGRLVGDVGGDFGGDFGDFVGDVACDVDCDIGDDM